MKQVLNRAALAAVAMFGSAAAFAESTPIDFTAITGSIDMGTVVAGVLGVAGVVMVLTLATKGASTISNTVKKS